MSSATQQLRYRSPATYWTDALPIGTGRIGAMVYGDPGHDRWQLNDDTCWSGSPASTAGEPASDAPSPEVIKRVRELLFAGRADEAEEEIKQVQFGHSQAYQPLAELEISTSGPDQTLTDRTLDLQTAITGWHSDAGSAEIFASAAAGAIIGRYAWSAPRDLTIRLTAAHADYGRCRVTADDHRIAVLSRMPSDVYPSRDHQTKTVVYDDTPGTAITAAAVVAVDTDGTLAVVGTDLVITGATVLRLAYTSETDFVDPHTTPHGDRDQLLTAARDRVDRVLAADHDQLRAAHVEEYRSWADRFELSLGDSPEPGESADTVDTDALLEQSAAGDVAPELVALMVHYGRYLMISSSRPGSRAINLQGIWNQWIEPPWHSNYTVNINTEMNYWPALVANLAECAEPLYELVETAAATGSDTARRVFDRPGWTAHHNTDVWGFTLPVGNGSARPSWASWPMAGFWLLRHFREQYAFHADQTFLTERAWPLLDGATEFGLATLCELPDHTLGVAPSTSPENHYLDPAGTPLAVTLSSTMDIALLRDTFGFWREAADVVAANGGVVDPERRSAVERALAGLPLPEPTDRGTYPEWRADLPEAEPTHRHQSHLYDLYPGDAVTTYDPAQSERLAAMAETLRLRGAYSTGWSLAWRINLHARLRNRQAATQSLAYFLHPVSEEIAASGQAMAQAGGVYRNLFCAHPPFQIDGNFGATAGVIEMLVQSHGMLQDRRIIDLLPCLPGGWSAGRLRGVRARGGLTLDVEWSAGEVTSVRIESDHDVRIVLRRPGRSDEPLDLSAGSSTQL